MPKLGISARLYRNTGTYNSPTWSAVNNISDVTVNVAWDKGDASTRASRVKGGAKTQLDLSVNVKMAVSDTDTAYLAFIGASLDDTRIDVLVLNGDIGTEGVRGFRFDALVYTANEDQALGNTLYDDMMLSPYIFDNVPKLAVVGGGGTITYTSL